MKTPKKQSAENYTKEIRRKARRIFSSEQIKTEIATKHYIPKVCWESRTRKYV